MLTFFKGKTEVTTLEKIIVTGFIAACEHVWNEPDVILGGIVCRKCGEVRFAGTEDKP